LGFKRDLENPGKWIATGRGAAERWSGRAITDIRAYDVRDLLDEVVKVSGPVAANRALTALKTAFRWRVDRDSETLPKSPCDGVNAPSPETARERVLDDLELAALWRAAEADGYPFGRMVQLLILTGCRRDEAREARWAEFDLPARKWNIPGRRTRNGRDHIVPLSDAAVVILATLPRIKGGAGLLFTKNGETIIGGLGRAKDQLADAMTRELGAEPERWVLHDIRRTFVTGLQRLGVRLEVAEAAVNHKSGSVSGVTAVYAKRDYAEEKRAALDAWARHVEAILSGKPATVVPLKRA
jgi:integrase